MDFKLTLALMAGAIVSIYGQTQQQSQCQRTYLTNAMNCAQNASINFMNLQYITSNGTKGQRPSENIQQFTMRACSVKMQLDMCGQNTYNQLVNSTLCLNSLDQQQLALSSSEIFGEYDRVCAHPCRHTLMEQIRSCFTYGNLDPNTFVDIAWSRGAILGTNREQVYQFCNNRQMVLGCVRQKAQMCPDSNIVFHRKGMEVSTIEKGVNLLCHMPRLYLEGLDCFTNPSPEVLMCVNNARMENQNNMMRLQQTKNDQHFRMQTCGVRLSQLNCEMQAFSRRFEDRCNKAITGIRTEMHCKILPSWCMQYFMPQYQQFCNPMNFNQEDRPPYAAAGTIVVTWSTVAILVLAAIFTSN